MQWFRLTRTAPAEDATHVRVALPDGRALDVPASRHPRARRLKLSVDERGPRVTLPARASLLSAQSFAQEHVAWLQAQLESLDAEAVEALRPLQTAALPLRGTQLPVHWQPARMTRVSLGDGDFLFEMRGQSEAAARRALRDFYEAQARADIARWLAVHAPGLPRPPGRIVLRRMTSQWGSLSPAGVVTLDLSLVLAPPETFEYVLVHELCHLIHANHSRAYWREVEARFPHWRRQRAWFRQHGRVLKATLCALT